MQLRWPQPSTDDLNTLYQNGAPDSWSVVPADRRDWILAARWIGELGIGSVLDIGCFDGGFLGLLGTEVRCAGIEMQPDAAKRASDRGIEIIGDDYGLLASSQRTFDVVVAFDVIEHTVDPQEFLRLAARAVSPGGHLILATGNTDAITWRLMGASYWYCWLAEHVSFVNPRWFETAAVQLGLRLERVVPFSHGGVTRGVRASETAKNIAYRAARTPLARIRAAQARRAGQQVRQAMVQSPPSWMSSNDHIIVLLTRAA